MEARAIPLKTLDEFFQLLTITSPTERLKLFTTYSTILSRFINSVDAIFNLFTQVDNHLKKEILANHPHIFCGAFKKVEDILVFKQRDKDYDFYQLIKDSMNSFTKHLRSLFTQPGQVLMLVEKHREAAEKIFSYEVPFAAELVFSRKNYLRLRELSTEMAITAAMRAVEVVSKKQQLAVEDFINLAIIYQGLPEGRSCYSYESTPRSKTKNGEYFLNKLTQLLNIEQHRSVVTSLTQRANFIRLYEVSVDCANKLLQFRSLMDILFAGKLVLHKLSYIVHNYWQLANDLLRQYPAEIAGLFHTVDELRMFCGDEHHAIFITNLPDKHLKTIAALFVKSANLEDWLWLAGEVAKLNPDPDRFSLTGLAAAVLKEYPFWKEKDKDITYRERIQALFGNAPNLIRLTSVCPGFAEKVIAQLNKKQKQTDEEKEDKKVTESQQKTFDPIKLFEKPEIFWQFLQAGGTWWLLSDFSLNVCVTYPNHISFMFEQSKYFAELDVKFAKRLLTSPASGYSYMRYYTIWKKVAALLEASNNVTFVLQNFPDIFHYYEYTEKPEKLLNFVKTADDLIALVKMTNFAMAKREEYSSEKFENKTIEEYIKSPECRLPDLLLSFTEPGSVLVRLAQAHPLLVNRLIEHHTKKMLPVLNLQVFKQLDFSQCLAFAERAPETVAALFVKGEVDLQYLLQMLKGARFEYSGYTWLHRPFCEVFKRQPSGFANLFVAGKQEDKVTAIQTYPIFTDLLFEIAPDIMAKAFCSSAFVLLLKIAPATAAKLLNQLKDSVINLIPSQADLDAVNKENPMLMKLFALQWPEQAASHLAALKVTFGSVSLFKAIDMTTDISDEQMALSAFGQKRLAKKK